MKSQTPPKKTPLTKVHWNCYGNCNMHCDFCYGWYSDKTSISYSQAIKLLDNIYNSLGPGTKFVFGGGDPLLRKDIVELVRYASLSLKFFVEIQTNAIKLRRELFNSLIPYIDKFGFSIDGEDNETHYAMRQAKGNFEHIFNVLLWIDNYNSNSIKTTDVTIRTLISKKNKSQIKCLYDKLVLNKCVTKWSLRQFIPLEEGKNTKIMHEIEDEFHDIVEEIIEYCQSKAPSRIKIAKVDGYDMQNCYCLIAPNGDVYYQPDYDSLNISANYTSIGNMLMDCPEEVISNVTKKCINRSIRDKKESLLKIF
jgi:AdoMet-dependent heme synthase